MRLFPAALLLLCLSMPAPVRADALAPPRPRGTNPSQEDLPATRRTGRMPARIEVAPSGAAQAPTHVVITISRDALRQVMASPGAAETAPLDDGPADRPSDTVRHVLAAGLLALAVLSVPFLVGGRRRGGAAAALVLAVVGSVVLVRATGVSARAADITAPRPRAERNAATSPPPAGGPQTVEVVIVPGKGPVLVQLTYAPRR